MDFDVVGVGTIVVDHQVFLSGFPLVDTKNEAQDDHLQVGGPVPTALALMTRFGKRCAFVGSWGDDSLGAFVEADLSREQIDFVGSSRRNACRTGFAQVWVDQSSGARTIAYRRCARPVQPAELDTQLLQRCAALYLDGWPPETALAAAKIVKQNGGTVFLDTGAPKPGMRELLPLVDVLNCPVHFLQSFLGTSDCVEGGRTLLKAGPRLVTVTNGAQGVRCFHATGDEFVPALEVAAVDTTGAGDVFAGALCHAVLAGWSDSQCVRFAAVTAGLKCSARGNRSALPTLETVLASMPRLP